MAKVNVAGLTTLSAGIVLLAVFLMMVACEVQAQSTECAPALCPPRMAIIHDDRGQQWIVTEGPRAIGSPISSFHVHRGALTREPLPPIITPGSVQPLGGGYYQANPGYVPRVNPWTGQVER